MPRKKMTVEEMEEKYPNMWIFIVDPEYHEGTTQLKSGIVHTHDVSRDEVYEASRKYKDNAAIRFM